MKLTYFNARGLSETIRYMFAVADEAYEDFRIPFTLETPGDFSTISRPVFDEMKAEGSFRASMDKLPLLTVDGTHLAQSKAIERFVARRLGFMGYTDLEAAQIDAICEHVRDLKDSYKKAKAEGELEIWWPKFLSLSDALNAAIPEFLLATTRPTLAHITLYNFYNCFFDDVANAQKSVQHCPTIASMCLLVKNDPRVVAWEKNRPSTPF
jgi:prostaglandin-H2 D-isomerase / glutathione transferase